MKNIQIFIINILIVFVYFLFLFFLGNKQSGGDIFIIAMTNIFAFFHILILILLKFFNRINSTLFAILGVILGVLFSFSIFNYFFM